MTPSAAKNKGRRLCKEVRDLLLSRAPHLEAGDIEVTSSGATGRDLKLSPEALRTFPFAIECKNVEKIQIWESYEQACSHQKQKWEIPLLIFRRNGADPLVCLSLHEFLDFVRGPSAKDREVSAGVDRPVQQVPIETLDGEG